MSAICASPIKARILRVTKLDACGAPVTGASSAVVTTKGFVSVSSSPQYEDGTEYVQKNANGELCVNDIDPPSFKRLDLEMIWCVMDPDLFVFMGGDRLLTTGAPVTGTGVVFGEGESTVHYSIELWQPVSGTAACDAAGVQRYVYWAFLNVTNSRIGDFTFENGAFNFTTSGQTKSASPLWGTGPASTDWIEQPVELGDHYLFNITTTPPPTNEACGAVLLT